MQGDDREVFITVREFQNYLKKNINSVGLKDEFLSRYLNEGFSGGEKKRSEVLQMAVLKPKISILDEPDSGLDIEILEIILFLHVHQQLDPIYFLHLIEYLHL